MRADQLDEFLMRPMGQVRGPAIYVTAREPTATIDSARESLIVGLAQARNTGMKFSPGGDRILALGAAPIVMEPVKARITLLRPGAPRVVLLDHDGRPTAGTLKPAGGTLTIDGARDRTPYYLVRY